ncbi:MAG: GTP-binding signal recognition particle G-domain protein [Ignavibacteria bacterium]|nr:GTP-binding signal recognition particle G-domain protein [Ignavibacteria bacterium]
MKIKKFIAASMKEGKALVINELGEDAVILSSRVSRKTDGSNEEFIEIVAAIDENPVKEKKTQPKLPIPQMPVKDRHDAGLSDTIQIELQKSLYEISNRLNKFELVLKELSHNSRYKYSSYFGPIYGQLYEKLRDADVSEEFSLELIGNLYGRRNFEDLQQATSLTRRLLSERLNSMPPFLKSDKRLISLFIGTSGSGKTLTLVKLAVVCKMVLKGNVLVVSADSRKINGHDQLETFSTVAGIPFVSAQTTLDLREIIESETKRDFILIDTPSTNQHSDTELVELERLLNASYHDLLYLVGSSTVSKTVMRDVLLKFTTFKPSGLILTKLDEAVRPGQIIEPIIESGLPLAYFTTGQRIPEDIEAASSERLSELILPDFSESE